MRNIHIDNINVEEIRNNTKKGSKYSLKRVMAAGLVIISMVPFLTGCGKTDKQTTSVKEETGITQMFTEEEKTKDYIFLTSDFTNESLEELQSFGKNVKKVYIQYCFYIDDLAALSEYCPNIEEVYLSYSPSISDLSFLCSLPNLKKVNIKENGYVTPELVDYFDKHGIEHNITQDDLNNVEELDRIISEIITEDMTDEEKIQAVTFYVIDNYRYRISKVAESNEKPLSSTLENQGGVCASYAYLLNILLRKAGIKSYEVDTENKLIGHAWNIVETDGKYYYIDATNIKQFPGAKYVLKYFNIGFNYMVDPRATGLSAMDDFDKSKKITIPVEMIEDIERGESEKTIMEKYGNSATVRLIELILLLVAVGGGITLTCKGIGAIHDTVTEKKRREAREAARRRAQYAEQIRRNSNIGHYY